MATSHPFVVGVDPGLDGAICVVDRTTMEIKFLMDMPCNQVPSKRHKGGFKREVNGLYIGRALYKYAPQVLLGIVEGVGSRPKQGLESTFRFGLSAGIVEGVLNGLAIKTIKPKAAAWKMGLGLTSNKESSLALARHTWPRDAALFKRKKDDGRAEAALLALWAIKFGGEVD